MAGSPRQRTASHRWHQVLTIDAPPKRQQRLSSKDWKPHKRKIARLRNERKTYEEIRQILSDQDSFHPTFSQLKNYITKKRVDSSSSDSDGSDIEWPRRENLYNRTVSPARSGRNGVNSRLSSISPSPESRERIAKRQLPENELGTSQLAGKRPRLTPPPPSSMRRKGSLPLHDRDGYPHEVLSPAQIPASARTGKISNHYARSISPAEKSNMGPPPSPRRQSYQYSRSTSPEKRRKSGTIVRPLDRQTPRIESVQTVSQVLTPENPSKRDTGRSSPANLRGNFYVPPASLRKEPISNTGMKSLHLAALGGSAAVVKILAGSGHGDINGTTDQKRTAIHLAVENGFGEVVRELLVFKDKINLFIPDVDGLMPVHVAALKGNGHIMSLLLKAGADVLSRTSSGKTALHILIDYDHDELLLDILSTEPLSREFVHVKDDHGWTLLHMVAKKLKHGLAECLVTLGASPNDATVFGTLPDTMEAAESRKSERLTPLHVLMRVLFSDPEKYQPVPDEVTKMVDLFLRSGASVTDRLSEGRTLLHDTAKFPFDSILDQFLKRDRSRINEPDDRGSTPLHYAVYRNMTKCVEILLRYNADTSVLNSNGYNALHAATLKGDKDIMEKLLEHGVDPNARDEKGETALHIAIVLKKNEAISLLVGSGADLEAPILNENYSSAASVEAKATELSSVTNDNPDDADVLFVSSPVYTNGRLSDSTANHSSQILKLPPSPHIISPINSPSPEPSDATTHQTSATGALPESNPRYQCRFDDCGKTFTDRQNRNRHERVTHAPDKQKAMPRCEVPGCGMSFTRKDNLQKHMRRKHPEIDFETQGQGSKRLRNETSQANNGEGSAERLTISQRTDGASTAGHEGPEDPSRPTDI